VSAVHSTDVLVLGGGAAGLFCAATAAEHGRQVTVIEHNDRPGKKIRISGGGRCNFTNREVTHRNFLSSNPDFARSALARYTPRDFLDLIERHGIAWHEKTLGQLFCDGSAQQVIDMLLHECARTAVKIHYGVQVNAVRHDGEFVVECGSTVYRARALVVATGGLSIPSLGATDLGYRIANTFSIPVITPEPALVPLLCDRPFTEHFGELSGISIPVVARAGRTAFRENLLFTHRGLSGPAILQASSYWHHGESIEIDLLPDMRTDDVFTDTSDRREAATVLGALLPKRFVRLWSDLPDGPIAGLAPRQRDRIVDALHAWRITPNGTEGFAKAEVTRGGVDTRALSSKTMECVNVPGLHFIGEVVDVTGWLGGYNFQWAWSSAAACGRSLQDM
jgi:predicted Rossmann fold flavoprotein